MASFQYSPLCALFLVVTALVAVPPGIPYWATLAAALLVFVASPLFVRSALARLEQRVLAADRGAAGELLSSLPESPLVRLHTTMTIRKTAEMSLMNQ